MSVAKYKQSNATAVFNADELAFTASAVLTADQSDQIVKNTGATGAVVLTLPAAAPNLEFTMMVTAAFLLTLLCAGTDKISWGANGTPGSNTQVSSSQLYANVCLHSPVAGVWCVKGAPVGTINIA